MKLRSWFVVGWSVCVGTGIVIACGGTSDDNNGGKFSDASADSPVNETGTPDAPNDSGAKKDTNDAACDLSKSFLDDIPADAAIDDAGRNTGVCKACIKSKCDNKRADCDTDCDCKGVINNIFTCVQKGGGLINCAQTEGAGVPQSTLINVVAPLGICVQNECKDECIPASLQDASFDALPE